MFSHKSSSFCCATPKLYRRKRSNYFFTCAVLLSRKGLNLNKINVFCLLITDYDITKKMKIKGATKL